MTENTQIKNVLVVDDEPTVLTLLDMTLRKAFKVTKFSNPIKALEFLETGYKPGVIISDLMMPEMYGTEFLSKTLEIVPEAVRIIVTAYSSSKEIISSINKAHAYMFLKKPWEKIELFQSVVVAWDKYEYDQKLLNQNNSTDSASQQAIVSDISEAEKRFNKQIVLLNEESKKDKETISELKDKITDLKNQSSNKSVGTKELALSFSYLIHEFEKLWFTNHTENVHYIVSHFLNKIALPAQIKIDIENASLLHNIVITQMPDNIRYRNPNNLEDKYKEQYFYYFTQSLEILNKVKHFSKYYSMISQIWEHKNGTGFPNKVSGENFEIGSQIIALANIYHTSVYGLSDEQYNKLLINGIVTQSYAENDIRHKQTIKEFYKNTNWFDRDLLNTFQDLIMEKTCHSLKPEKQELTINLKDMLKVGSKIEDNSSNNSNNKEKLVDNKGSKKETYKEMPIEQISVGMKTAQNIITKTGMTIIKSDTEINEQVLSTIQRFYAKGMLPQTLLIYTN